jgi:hypothetical protein
MPTEKPSILLGFFVFYDTGGWFEEFSPQWLKKSYLKFSK